MERKDNATMVDAANQAIEDTREEIVRLISEHKKLVIRPGNTGDLICRAYDITRSINCNHFTRWVNTNPEATDIAPVKVYELANPASYLEIFEDIPGTWNQKWLYQNQVLSFCTDFPEWLAQEGNITMFLVKKDEAKSIDIYPGGNLVVVRAILLEHGLSLSDEELDCPTKWPTINRVSPRIVCPKINPYRGNIIASKPLR